MEADHGLYLTRGENYGANLSAYPSQKADSEFKLNSLPLLDGSQIIIRFVGYVRL
jgi:hypothetical protein